MRFFSTGVPVTFFFLWVNGAGVAAGVQILHGTYLPRAARVATTGRRGKDLRLVEKIVPDSDRNVAVVREEAVDAEHVEVRHPTGDVTRRAEVFRMRRIALTELLRQKKILAPEGVRVHDQTGAVRVVDEARRHEDMIGRVARDDLTRVGTNAVRVAGDLLEALRARQVGVCPRVAGDDEVKRLAGQAEKLDERHLRHLA